MKKYTITTFLVLLILLNFNVSASTEKNNSRAAKYDTISQTVAQKESVVKLDPVQDVKIILAKEEVTPSDNAKWIIPLITLILGFLLNRIYEYISSKFRIKRAGKRWVIELQNAVALIPDQIVNLEEFRVKVSQDTIDKPQLSIISTVRGDIFQSLDKNDLLQYIEVQNLPLSYYISFTEKRLSENKKIIKISTDAHNHIARLNHYYDLTVKRYESYLEGISKHTHSLTLSMQNLQIVQRSFFLTREKSGKDETNDETQRQILELYKEYFVKLSRGEILINTIQLKEEYFGRMNSLLVPIRHEEKVPELLDAINQCLNALAGLDAEKSYMLENITTLIERYNELAIEALDVINTLQGLPKVVSAT